MNSDLQPRWNLLPHDPVAFFELPDGFDRTELKRRYNRLLRQYKPEKFPEQFQKLRAAFEELDAQLRYGQAVERPATRVYAWQASDVLETAAEGRAARAPVESVREAASAPARPQPAARRPTIVERLGKEPPAEIYKELTKRPVKSPFEFYALAVLADVVAPQDPLLFCKWLLTGLKAHPQDPALWRLLHAYFQSTLRDEDVPKVLTAVSKVVTNDRFYFLTEPLWDRLLAAGPFEKFLALLTNCESGLRDHQIQGKVAFYLHILRPALWKAPQAWVDGVMDFLNQNSEFVSGNLEYDLELTSRLIQYQRERDKFLNGHPVRDQIDKAIQAFCTADEWEAEHAVVACQTRLAGDAESILEAFPPSLIGNELELGAWIWISNEIGSRLELETRSQDVQKTGEALYSAMREIDNQEPNRPWVTCVMAERVSHAAATIFAYAWPFMFLGPFLPAWFAFTMLNVVLGVASVFGYWLWLRHRTVTRMFENYRVRLATRRYRRVWRPRVLRVFSASHAPFSDVCQIADALVSSQKGDLNVSTWVPYFLRADYGLLVYSLAQRFQR
jgi:hypothetical protein